MLKIVKKNLAWVLTHTLVVIMLIALLIKPELWKPFTQYSGYLAVGFLLAVLSLNPIINLLPHIEVLKKLNKYRRELGVASFSYACIHFICFAIKRGSFSAVLPYLIHPALIPVFWVAMPIFLVLTITSNKYFIKKLGTKKWKKLHQKVYYVEIAIILHMILVGQFQLAIVLFLPLIILQVLRIRNKMNTNVNNITRLKY
jgi:sulfoxide reductase heme-binding subunit YedZ